MEEDNKEIVIEDVEIIEETVIDDTINAEQPKDKKGIFFDKIKKQKEKHINNYKNFNKEFEKSDDTIKKLSDKISWDIIKILVYFYILSLIVTDLPNFLLVLIFVLVLIKIDVLEFIVKFIRSFFED